MFSLLAAIRNPAVNTALGTPGASPGATFSRFETLISMIVGLLTVVGGIWFTFQLFTGAVAWISAGSDKDGVQRAKAKFTNGVIGLVILIFAYGLIAFAGRTLGYNIFAVSSTLGRIMP